MVPNEAFQVTDLPETVPCTLAVNCSVPPVLAEVEAGDTVTEVTTGFGGGGGAVVTVTCAEAALVGSAVLVWVTGSGPAFAGAVYSPAGVTVPSVAFQATVLLDVVP